MISEDVNGMATSSDRVVLIISGSVNVSPTRTVSCSRVGMIDKSSNPATVTAPVVDRPLFWLRGRRCGEVVSVPVITEKHLAGIDFFIGSGSSKMV